MEFLQLLPMEGLSKQCGIMGVVIFIVKQPPLMTRRFKVCFALRLVTFDNFLLRFATHLKVKVTGDQKLQTF